MDFLARCPARRPVIMADISDNGKGRPDKPNAGASISESHNTNNMSKNMQEIMGAIMSKMNKLDNRCSSSSLAQIENTLPLTQKVSLVACSGQVIVHHELFGALLRLKRK